MTRILVTVVDSSIILILHDNIHATRRRAVTSAEGLGTRSKKTLESYYLGNKVYSETLSSSPSCLAVPNLARVGLLGQKLNQDNL